MPLVGAFICFNLSQMVSAVRLNTLLEKLPIRIGLVRQLLLYYIGMFYNLALPGGIGGDAYKVVHFKKSSPIKTKKIVGTLFYDRASGLAAILFLLSILLLNDVFSGKMMVHLEYGILFIILALYPFFLLFTKKLFSDFFAVFISVNVLAIIVQVLQLISVYLIFISLQDQSFNIWYWILFLSSSIATIAPISFGGIGIREIIFLYGSSWATLSKESSIAIALVFFLIATGSAFIGAFLNVK